MRKPGRLLPILMFSITISINIFADSGKAAEALLTDAEQSFRQGNEYLISDPDKADEAYRAAVGYYNSLIESGIVNSGIYYNLANSYARLKQTGMAVLNYRRALLFAPNDSRVSSNLEYVRSIQKNGFNTRAENEILHILFFWHYRLPIAWKIIGLVVINIIFWGSLIFRFFGFKLTKLSVISLAIVLIISASVIVDMRESKTLHGVVTAESTIGRLGDSRSYEAAFDEPLYEGVEFTIVQRRVGWLLAELPDESMVWLEEDDCGIIEEIPQQSL